MRITKGFTLLAGLLILVLILPSLGWAKRVTSAGSMTFTTGATGGTALTNELVVTMVISNAGLEKTIPLQAPLPGPIYALPFFVNKNVEDEDEDHGSVDTIIVLTNATAASLPVTITLWDSSGTQIGSAHTLTPLAPHESRTIFLSSLLS